MMKINKILTTAAALLLTGAVSAQNQEMDKFVDDLMSRMTLHSEKIGQQPSGGWRHNHGTGTGL